MRIEKTSRGYERGKRKSDGEKLRFCRQNAAELEVDIDIVRVIYISN